MPFRVCRVGNPVIVQSRIVRANADSMIKELAEKGFCDMTQFTATEVED